MPANKKSGKLVSRMAQLISHRATLKANRRFHPRCGLCQLTGEHKAALQQALEALVDKALTYRDAAQYLEECEIFTNVTSLYEHLRYHWNGKEAPTATAQPGRQNGQAAGKARR